MHVHVHVCVSVCAAVPFDQVNITGAVAILNTGSWDSYPAIVLSHQPGSNSFTYNASGQYHDDAIHNRYYLEDALDFIDLPSEWFYDKDTQRAYWFPEDGQGPQAQSRIVGKVSTYAFNITNCSFVQFANMTFFATTFWASSLDEHLGSPERSFIDNLTFTSLNFSYPSYSKRMLKDVRPPMWTLVSSLFYRPGTEDIMARHANKNKMTDEQLPGYGADTDHGFHKIVNCTWMYADSPALNVQGKFCNISNNYFAYNDWSGADEDVAIGAQSTLNNDRGIGDIFHRNTLYKNGASTGYRPPPGSNISFNHIVAQCWGDIQHDGAGMQVCTRLEYPDILRTRRSKNMEIRRKVGAEIVSCPAFMRCCSIADKSVNWLESRKLRTTPGYNAGPHIL